MECRRRHRGAGAVRDIATGGPAQFRAGKSRKGYHTIRANYAIRILLRDNGPQSFEIVAVGNHDYIYEVFF